MALGTHMAIVGGGDNAFDVAHILLEKGIRVTIVVRSDVPHAQPRLIERVVGRADVRTGCVVTALDENGDGVRLRLSNGGMLDADRVVLLLGYRPNSGGPWLDELALRKNADGYLVVDGNMETSCPGDFCGGRCANSVHPCVATGSPEAHGGARDSKRCGEWPAATPRWRSSAAARPASLRPAGSRRRLPLVC